MISPTEIAALQGFAELQMTTEVGVMRQTIIEGPQGDDESVFATAGIVYGWLSSRPSPIITEVGGVQALVNTYALYLPVGTDIASGDQVIIAGRIFNCSDTTSESTLQPMLEVSLRRAE